VSGVWTKASHFHNAQAATGLCNTSLHDDDDDDDDDDTRCIKAFVAPGLQSLRNSVIENTALVLLVPLP